MTVSPTLDQEGEIDGVLCTAVDVTEKRLFEVRLAAMAAQLATASHRFELALENSGITVFEQDADLRYTYVYNPPPGTRPEDFIGRTDAEIFPEHELRKIVPAKERVLASGGRETRRGRARVRRRPALLHPDRRGRRRRGRPRSSASSARALDLTERRQDEKRMRLMMRELTHRSKNLLAVIQAMARKTAEPLGRHGRLHRRLLRRGCAPWPPPTTCSSRSPGRAPTSATFSAPASRRRSPPTAEQVQHGRVRR